MDVLRPKNLEMCLFDFAVTSPSKDTGHTGTHTHARQQNTMAHDTSRRRLGSIQCWWQ